MFIQAIPQYLDPYGQPAVGFLVYIGRSNTDPRVESNKLTITDGMAGGIVSNPYQIDQAGFPRNSNGQRCNPYISGDEYSIMYCSPAGSVLWQNPRQIGDNAAAQTGVTGDIVGAVISDFAKAKSIDLSEYDTIYVQSYAAGWDQTPTGPIGGFYAYRTGSMSTPSSGNPGKFCDSVGNEFRPFLSQRLYAEMFGASTAPGVDSTAAFQDMLNAASERKTACYADGGIYRFDIQAGNTDADYSLFGTYGVKLPSYSVLIGNGATEIRNTSANSDQVLFFAEDCDIVRIEGCNLNGNATSGLAGVLYSAGCTEVVIPPGTTIAKSGPVYLSGSKAKNPTGVAIIDAVFSECFSYCLSGRSGGASSVRANIQAIGCYAGCEITSVDSDGHGGSYVAPNWTLGTVTGDFTNDVLVITSGSVSFDKITATCRNVIAFALDDDDVISVNGAQIKADCARFITATATDNAIIETISIESVTGTSNARGIEIAAAKQLVESVRIGYLNISGGTDAIYLQDDTALGRIYINSGLVSGFTTGINFAGADQQVIDIAGTDFSGCTSRFNTYKPTRIIASGRTFLTALNDDYDAFTMPTPAGWTVEKVSNYTCRITHNIGHTNYVTLVQPAQQGCSTRVTARNANSVDVRLDWSSDLTPRTAPFYLNLTTLYK